MLMPQGYDCSATGGYSQNMTEWGIDTLFNPGKRHMDEEKRRLQSTREEIGDSSGGRRIDLESGTVKISRSTKATPAEDEATRTEDESAEDEPAEDEVAGNEAAGIESAKDEVEAVKAAESTDQTARSDAAATDEEPGSSKPGK
jgi:hypothetical protein